MEHWGPFFVILETKSLGKYGARIRTCNKVLIRKLFSTIILSNYTLQYTQIINFL